MNYDAEESWTSYLDERRFDSARGGLRSLCYFDDPDGYGSDRCVSRNWEGEDMRVKKAARIMDRSETTVYGLINRGKLQTNLLPGGVGGKGVIDITDTAEKLLEVAKGIAQRRTKSASGNIPQRPTTHPPTPASVQRVEVAVLLPTYEDCKSLVDELKQLNKGVRSLVEQGEFQSILLQRIENAWK